ncbi:MAG: DNA-directed RNA polymerase subunit omega, partial [Bacteroidetes bacterium]|nr:DNA-directed RNA polymerase subunit omega [Bacteroidota bacterium]
MSIKTVDMDLLAKLSGNLYQSVSILAKRSRQISVNTKSDLDEKLAYFEGFEQELEDPRFQEEQARVSLEFENKPEPTELAVEEMVQGEIYFRDPTEETER